MSHRDQARERLESDVLALVPQAGGDVAFGAAVLLHLIPLLDGAEFMLLCYLRLQHRLRDAPVVTPLVQLDLPDVEVAAYVGWSLRTLQRWRSEKYFKYRSALRVFVPKIERLIERQEQLPVTIGFRYFFLATDPELSPGLLAQARTFAGRTRPFTERYAALLTEQAQRHPSAVANMAAAAADQMSVGAGDKMSGATGDKLSGAKKAAAATSVAKLAGAAGDKMSQKSYETSTSKNHEYDRIVLRASPEERAAYERWIYDEVHRLTGGRALDPESFRAFFKQWRVVGDGPATGVAARVREQLDRVDDPLAYLMGSLKRARGLA